MRERRCLLGYRLGLSRRGVILILLRLLGRSRLVGLLNPSLFFSINLRLSLGLLLELELWTVPSPYPPSLTESLEFKYQAKEQSRVQVQVADRG
jgi:hypothetical protein